MNYYKFTITKVLFFTILFTNAQNTGFYLQIEDESILPKISKDKNSKALSIEINDSELNRIYNKYKIYKFEKAFPTAVSPSLKNIYLIKCNDKNLGKELKQKFKNKIPRLDFLQEPEQTYDPNDYGLAMGQKNLDLINAKDAWDYTFDLPKITVAISDTYFDLTHEDLSMTLVGGTNSSGNYHGTSVAGMVGAITDNSIGLSSVGYDTQIAVSTIYGYSGDNEVLRLAQAGYRVINCSWINSCTYSSIQEELYNEIRNIWGTIVVFGAGNSGSNHLINKCMTILPPATGSVIIRP